MFHLLAFIWIGCAFAQQNINESNDNNWEQDSVGVQYLDPSAGASRVVPDIKTNFSCVGRRYGYFADVDNNCRLFIVCHPSITATGEQVIYQLSKFCPKSTRFDQRKLTCLPETDPKLIACNESVRHFPVTEGRYTDVRIIHKFEDILQSPETEQRVEQVLIEEPQRDAVKGVHSNVRLQSVFNEQIPAKLTSRNEPIPQALPQPVEVSVIKNTAEPSVQQVVESVIQQNTEPIVQQVVAPLLQQGAEPVVDQLSKSALNKTEPVVNKTEPVVNKTEPVVNKTEPVLTEQRISVEPVGAQQTNERNVEPILETTPLTEPVRSPIVRRSAVKESVVTNTQTLRTSVASNGYVSPALALKNTQPINPSVIRTPVLLESHINWRGPTPQTQYVVPNRGLSRPLYVEQYLPFLPTQRVNRPPLSLEIDSRRQIVAQQQPIYYSPVQTNYGTIPQYLRTNVQNVLRPSPA